MRCPDCDKFTSFDDTNEPEVVAYTDNEGYVTGNVRVFLTCAECSTALKEATFEIEADFSEAVDAHKKAAKEKEAAAEKPENRHCDFALDIDVLCDVASRTATSCGYHATIWVTCSCGYKFGPEERSDEVQASRMEELT